MEHDSSDLDEFILAAIAQTCNLPRSALTLESLNFNIGMDCLAIMSVMNRIQLKFGARIDVVDARQLFAAVTLQELIEVIRAIVMQPPAS